MIEFPANVENDTFFRPDLRRSVPNDYERQEASVDASYRFSRAVRSGGRFVMPAVPPSVIKRSLLPTCLRLRTCPTSCANVHGDANRVTTHAGTPGACEAHPLSAGTVALTK